MKYLLAMSIVVLGCVSSPFVANDAFLQPWSDDLGAQDPYKGPYAALYQKGGKKLIYVAADHSVSTNSPTFRLVEKMFKTFTPDMLILEGFDPLQPAQRMALHAEECAKEDFKSCGESLYAVHLTNKTKSQFITGEPSDDEILKGVVRKGYEDKELVLFYLLRQIPQMKREDSLQRETFAAQANTYLDRRVKRLNINSQISFDDFTTWYQQKMDKTFNLDDIDTEVPAPHYDGTYMQKLSHEVGVIRDSTIIKRIANSLNDHDTVMVVYGGSHLSVQRLALEDMLDKPVSYYQP